MEENTKAIFLQFLVPMCLSLPNPPPSLFPLGTIFHKVGSEIILDAQNKYSYIGLLSDLHMNGSTPTTPERAAEVKF